jgi:DNA-nicking Smr family endonuclease
MIPSEKQMNDDDLNLFRQEVADVMPLQQTGQVFHKKRTSPTPGQMYRREAAQRNDAFDENMLPSTFVEFVHPEAVISFKRGGIQNGVFRKLQQGAYEIEAVLDLHGLTVEEARREVYRFIQDCLHYDVRSALISHGKGRRNKEQRPLLKSFLVRWLPLFPEIMAYHSAQKCHGGTGAVYLLLRKSEKQKKKTRERLGLAHGKPIP